MEGAGARPIALAVGVVLATWALRTRLRFNASPVPLSLGWLALALVAFAALEAATLPPVADVAGACALVTGASGGIGAVIARTLAREGVSKLIVAARQLDKLEAVAADIRAAHPAVSVTAVRADVASAADRAALAAAAAAGFDAACPLLLVNNAGVERWKPFDVQTPADVALQLGVNLHAPIELTAALWPQLRRSRGHVVNVGSIAGKAGVPYATAYAASKHGLAGFTAALRAEQKTERGPVSVHHVAPGFVTDTGMGLEIAISSGLQAAELAASGGSEAWETAEAVVRVVRYDEPERIVNHPPVRAPLTLLTAAPRLADLAARHSADFATLRRMGEGLRSRGARDEPAARASE